jgi:hypothetical protein
MQRIATTKNSDNATSYTTRTASKVHADHGYVRVQAIILKTQDSTSHSYKNCQPQRQPARRRIRHIVDTRLTPALDLLLRLYRKKASNYIQTPTARHRTLKTRHLNARPPANRRLIIDGIQSHFSKPMPQSRCPPPCGVGGGASVSHQSLTHNILQSRHRPQNAITHHGQSTQITHQRIT